jgi:hypothetical protein
MCQNRGRRRGDTERTPVIRRVMSWLASTKINFYLQNNKVRWQGHATTVKYNHSISLGFYAAIVRERKRTYICELHLRRTVISIKKSQATSAFGIACDINYVPFAAMPLMNSLTSKPTLLKSASVNLPSLSFPMVKHRFASSISGLPTAVSFSCDFT